MPRFLKILLFIIIAAGVAIGSVLTIRAVNNRGAAPVAWWKMDEGQGQTTYDASGNGNNGTLGASTSDTTPDPTWKNEEGCKNGKCLQFDGSDDYVNAADNASLRVESGNFTVSVWVKPSVVQQQLILFKGNPNMGNGYILVMNRFGSDISLTKGGVADQAVSYTFQANNWYHIVVVQPLAGNVIYYINGQLIGSYSNTSNYNSSSGENLYIGDAGTFFVNKFNGFIDDVLIYNYARSAAQIKADYNKSAGGKGASVKVASLQEQQNASDGLVGYWKMDEASWAGAAGEVVDSSGAGNNGAAVGGASTTTAAKFNRAGNFDGGDDYVDVSDNTALNPSNITFGGWFKTSGTNDYSGIIQKYNTVTNYAGYILGIDASSKVRCDIMAAGSYIPLTSSQTVEDGNWHFAMCSYDGVNINLYVDGIKTTTPWAGGLASSVGYALSIGRDQFGFGGNRFFNGQIDDVKIYNKARTAEQIRRDYEAGPPPVAHLRMDENTGQTAYDTSGTNNGTLGTDATANASDPVWTNGKYGSGLKFDGSDDYVDVGNGASLNITGTITVEAWVYPKAIPASAVDVVGKRTTSNTAGYILWFGSTGLISFSIMDGGAWHTSPQKALTLNKWQYIVGTYNGGVLSLYIDGILQGTPTAYTGDIDTIAANVWIGKSGYEVTYFFNGLIDEVRIYNYARTPKQIMEDMNASHPAVGSPVGSYAGYWNFDEGNGDTAYDKSINKSNGDLAGSCPEAATCPTWTTAGKFGKALSFDGSDDYVNAGDTSSLEPSTNITVSAWVKVNGAGTWAGQDNLNDYILAKGRRFSEPYLSYGFAWRPSDGIFSFNLGTATLESATSSVAYTAPTNWVHLVGTYDGSNVRFYVNGNLNGIISKTGSISYNLGDNPNDGLWIGQWGGVVRAFNGLIDEVKIYPFALSPLEIKEEFNRGSSLKLGALGTEANGITPSNSALSAYCVPGDATSCAAPVAHWKMDEKADNTCSGGVNDVCDTSGNGNDGANTGGPVWKSAASCHSGSCLLFDGADDYMKTATNFSNAANSPITLSAWVNSNVITNDGAYSRRIILPGGNQYFSLTLSSGKLTAYYYNGSQLELSDSVVVSTGVWYHVVGAYDGTTMRLYVNGILKNSVVTTLNAITSGLIRIGIYSDDTNGKWNGLIDDVRIYNYARTPAQIAWDYNRGGPVASWSMDSVGVSASPGTALNVYDSSGNPSAGSGQATGVSSGETMNNGTITGATWKDGSNCKYGACLSFNGVDDYVSFSTSNIGISGNASVSLSAWVKTSSTGAQAAVVFGSLIADTTFSIFLNGNGAGSVGCAYQAGHTFNSAAGVIPLNTWTHILITKTPGTINATTQIYVNGVAVAGSDPVGGGNTPNFDFVYASLGVWNNNGIPSSNDYHLIGLIDEARIYNTALTADQVAALYNNNDRAAGASLEGNLVGEWRLDENASLYAADTHYQRDGKWSYALNFDGSDDYVSVANTAFLPTGASTRSMFGWIKTNGTRLARMNYFGYGGAADGLAFDLSSGVNVDGKIYFIGYGAGYDLTGTKVIGDGVWHYIGVVYSGTVLSIYVDGILDISANRTLNTSNIVTYPFVIGRQSYPGTMDVNGLIDDVRIYNYALTPLQVKTLYNENSAVRFGPTEGLP